MRICEYSIEAVGDCSSMLRVCTVRFNKFEPRVGEILKMGSSVRLHFHAILCHLITPAIFIPLGFRVRV